MYWPNFRSASLHPEAAKGASQVFPTKNSPYHQTKSHNAFLVALALCQRLPMPLGFSSCSAVPSGRHLSFRRCRCRLPRRPVSQSLVALALCQRHATKKSLLKNARCHPEESATKDLIRNPTTNQAMITSETPDDRPAPTPQLSFVTFNNLTCVASNLCTITSANLFNNSYPNS